MEITKKNSLLYMASALLITANIAVLALLFIHRGPRQNPPPPRENVFNFLTRELSLSKAQQKIYDSLRSMHHSEAMKLQDSLRRAKDIFFDMLNQEQASDDAAIAQESKVSSLNSALDMLTYRHFQKLRAICDPAQQKRFDAVIREAVQTIGRQQQQSPDAVPPKQRNLDQ